MAIDVVIKQKGLFKKKLNFNYLKNILDSDLSFGLMNPNYVLQSIDEPMKQSLSDIYAVAYDPSQIGRGFQFTLIGNDIELSLPLPCTRHDIHIFYNAIEKLLRHFKLDSFSQDDEIYTIADIHTQKAFQESWMENYLSDPQSDEYSIMIIIAALYPLWINFDRLFIEETNHFDAFSTFLEELQSRDVFYPSPLMFEDHATKQVFGTYVLTKGVATVLPMKGRSLAVESDNVLWLVMFGEAIAGEFVTHGYLKYDDFVSRENLDEGEEFDHDNYIFELNDEIIGENKYILKTLDEILHG